MTSGFKIEKGQFKKPKSKPVPDMDKLDQVAEDAGFVSREAPKKRGRRRSPRTGQVHANVFPQVSEAISDEAWNRGITQGQLIEEMWALYEERKSS